MNRINTIWFLFSLLTVLPAFSQEEKKELPAPEISGYLKDLQGLHFVNRIDSLTSVNLLHNRINARYHFSHRISARLELRNRIFWGDQLKQIPDFGKTIDRYDGLADLSILWVNKPGFVMHSVIDRLVIQFQDEKWDIKLGRQRINWGVNTVWNPNDIFNAYNFLDFDYEERPGTDALRVQHYLKDNSTLEMAIKPGRHAHETIAGVLYKFNKKKFDWQVLGGIFRHDLVAGGGWAGNFKKAGFKGELSYFHPRKNILDSSGIVSLSVMADQTFKNDWYVSVAALFNSHPSRQSGLNAGIYGSNPDAKELLPFRYSFYTGFSKAITPISALSCSIIYSPFRNTLVFYPNYTWNTATDFDLDLTILSLFARDQGRYKTQGTSLFIRGKWSF